MGVMVEGVYHVEDEGPRTASDGSFRREPSNLREWIGTPGHPAEAGRYHLFVAWNCPWAHRALLTRALLGLDKAISVSYARPNRTDQGWVFDPDGPYSDPEIGVEALHEVYARHPEPYTGRVTVPVLWDRERQRIVSNESADIVQMLGRFEGTPVLRPKGLEREIDTWNSLIYERINNGVYRAGFAKTQDAYDAAVKVLFETLDRIEASLTHHDWLCGERFTEADLRLFPTLARFDVAYHYAFKCNIRKLSEYPALWRYARHIYHLPGVARTVDFDIYKRGYFSKSELRNPLGIIPAGPKVDWSL
ncbi:glutathione S-transferase family protein [Histidinibacterium aquaticum]|uniref:Glutathione-dependent reductase n=1 Tax=Histidinibacterium aquaticum TaxID=2613962 RepID=A0A5J5GDV9_9RHOB|nr:glutathione S-transferase C-terminal domain-containing protein [Histidinibacterium aquaticum]KAA9005982.1 glutathione-dependent reductase [Histidinibacterium aquaticum]